MQLPRRRLLLLLAAATVPLGAAAAVTTAQHGGATGAVVATPAATPVTFPPLKTPSPGAPHDPGPDHLAATDRVRHAQPTPAPPHMPSQLAHPTGTPPRPTRPFDAPNAHTPT